MRDSILGTFSGPAGFRSGGNDKASFSRPVVELVQVLGSDLADVDPSFGFLLQESQTCFQALEPLLHLRFKQGRCTDRLRLRHSRVTELTLKCGEHIERVFPDIRFGDSSFLSPE